MPSDLTDLVENPRENLDVELKQWLDLDEPIVRADLAWHIAALANHGGGYIVFGFKDDLRSDDEGRPPIQTKYNRDTFTSIVKRYLSPTFQCEVTIEHEGSGKEFPIIRIPGHGRAPVVAKADGPQDSKGRVQGIAAGIYYIRKPGPESAPIISAEEWGPLIRRCILNDRDSLLRDFAGLVHAPATQQLTLPKRLETWHREGETQFLHLLSQAKRLQWLVPLKDNRYQLSYSIGARDGELLPVNSLCQILKEVNNEVRNTVWTGWSMFYPFTTPDIAPAFHPEHPDGTGADVLEANLMVDRDFETSLPDFWRVAADGRVTLMRAYREDRERSVKGLQREAGTWLSPETILRETAELVTHARLLARRFENAVQVSFLCTWSGLKGRELADFDASIHWTGQVAKASQRTVGGEWSVAQLTAEWPAVVAELGCPVLRLLGFSNCGASLVEKMKSRFIKL